jgi:hypothetical protein
MGGMASSNALDANQDAAGVTIAGRCMIERLLGIGGMGSVYVALDMVTLRPIALKQNSNEANDTLLALFQREYQTLRFA